jgi:hypothetical protein
MCAAESRPEARCISSLMHLSLSLSLFGVAFPDRAL